jgi:hypothetical protein
MHHNGLLCFEKTAETAADEVRLGHEGRILALAAHPGVVGLAPAPSPCQHRTVLLTRAVPGRSLAVMDQLSASEVAGLGAAVATTIADLHDAGITHGRLGADHILVDTAGRPVLCGFAEAAAGRPGAAPGVGAAAALWSPAAARTVDVIALGRTLAALLAPLAAGAPTPTPLDRLLGRAAANGHRGSARRLARQLLDERFAPCLPARSRPPPGDRGRYAHR